MAQHIHHCSSCQKYTLQQVCPSCNTATVIPKPPKFSLDDKYAGLRREAKRKGLMEKGLY
ncbi:MAG TPA: RNA-protein complex protein Nop10 [Candidatus Nanoarchaeia archaeon]|nr:RNA-protein complex protein Nop10 [Candidatus Nanoarchaeia archaeon]